MIVPSVPGLGLLVLVACPAIWSGTTAAEAKEPRLTDVSVALQAIRHDVTWLQQSLDKQVALDRIIERHRGDPMDLLHELVGLVDQMQRQKAAGQQDQVALENAAREHHIQELTIQVSRNQERIDVLMDRLQLQQTRPDAGRAKEE